MLQSGRLVGAGVSFSPLTASASPQEGPDLPNCPLDSTESGSDNQMTSNLDFSPVVLNFYFSFKY